MSGFGEGSDRLDSWRMFDDYFGIVVSDEHDLARGNGAALEPSQLSAHRLLLHKGVDASEAEIERMTTAGLSLVNVHEVDSLADLEALVRAQFGVGLTLASALRTHGIQPFEGRERRCRASCRRLYDVGSSGVAAQSAPATRRDTLRDRLLNWFSNLPAPTRNRPFAMQEFEAVLGTTGRYINPALITLGWRRKRIWSTQ